jgi:hypothetical protein
MSKRVNACARELDVVAQKTPAGQTFGERLAKAVHSRISSAMRTRGAVLANAAPPPKAEDESFAEKLTKAVDEKSGRNRRKEQAERERSRYKNLLRKPTKGE